MGKVLLVHPSKVVRATLARHLAGEFDVVEALDGDSAWQTLVLDHDVAAVIAGPDVPRLKGVDLLERLRRSKLKRLKLLPFYFVGSETRLAEVLPEAEKLGPNGSIVNGMDKTAILALLAPVRGTAAAARGEQEDARSEQGAGLPLRSGRGGAGFRDAGLLSPALLAAGVERIFAHPGAQGSVLVFEVDAYAALEAAVGKGVAARITERFALLVRAKLSAGDIIGHYRPGCFVIVTRCHRLDQCAAFADRVARSAAAARIAVHGQPVRLSLSAAAAGRPEDGGLAGTALLQLALSRLAEARAAGAGQVRVHGAGRPAAQMSVDSPRL